MAVNGPRIPIQAPDLVPPTLSLVNCAFAPDAAEKREVGDRWGRGMEFQSLACSGDTGAYDVCTPAPFPDGARSSLVDVSPFGVVVSDTCSTFGFSYADYQGRALRKHRARESYVIAQQFWTGALIPGSFHLAAAGAVTDVNPGGAVTAPEGLALLEEELSECLQGARGMIFCSPRVFVNLFLSNGLYRPNNGRMVYSHMDTPIVPDAGFPGTAPDGSAESLTVEWMYGTAPAKVYRSNPKVYPSEVEFTSDPRRWQAVAQDRNDVTIRAISIAAVVVDPCCLLAIRVGVGAGTEEGGDVSPLVDHSGTITTGGTAQSLMAANPDRRYLVIENVSPGDLWFNFTTAAVVGQPSLKLPAGASYAMEDQGISSEAISIIGASTGQAFVAKEA